MENMSYEYPALLPADIGAVKGRGIMPWLSRTLITPSTDRHHFFVVGEYLPWDDDYVIMESIGKGIAIGRLSFYKPENVEIYRVNLNGTGSNMEMRRKALYELTRVGRARYDYILYAQLIAGAIQLFFTGHFPPYTPDQFPYGRNKDYICTEAANYGWRAVGKPIIRPGVVPVPAGYKQAEMDRKIFRVYPEPEKETSRGRRSHPNN